MDPEVGSAAATSTAATSTAATSTAAYAAATAAATALVGAPPAHRSVAPPRPPSLERHASGPQHASGTQLDLEEVWLDETRTRHHGPNAELNAGPERWPRTLALTPTPTLTPTLTP